MKVPHLRPEYVKHVPEVLDPGVLYISEEFETAGHLCCCGCGEEIFTPLNAAKWRVLKNPKISAVSLRPSIGNWKYPCESHYWITNNVVIDAGPMSKKAIDAVISRDRRDQDLYVKQNNQKNTTSPEVLPPKTGKSPGPIIRLIRWLFGK